MTQDQQLHPQQPSQHLYAHLRLLDLEKSEAAAVGLLKLLSKPLFAPVWKG